MLAEDLLDHPPSQRKVGVVGGSDVNGRLDDVVWPAGSGVEGNKEVVECLAGWPAISPWLTTSPLASSGQAPAVKTERLAGALAAYAYGTPA